MNITRLNKFLLFAAMGLFTLSSSVRAQSFEDTFSTNDSSDYTAYESFSGNGPGAAVFAINSSDQFQPTGGSEDTTIFFLNTGQTLSDTVFGDSVSITIDNIGSSSSNVAANAGLGFATGIPTSSGLGQDSAGAFNIAVTSENTAGYTQGEGVNPSMGKVPLNFTLGPIVETVTRTGNTTFSYSFSGAGLPDGTITGTFTNAAFAGKAVYFGPEIYMGSGSTSPGLQIEDNFTFTEAPEASTWAMFLGGVVMLAFCLHRRGSLFARAT